jgi:hypothetical protein
MVDHISFWFEKNGLYDKADDLSSFDNHHGRR